MYRDGNFNNLEWSSLDESHSAHWEKLSSVYGLEIPDADSLRKMIKRSEKPVLDLLAEKCVDDCWDFLFSLIPIENLSNPTGSNCAPALSPFIDDDFSSSIRNKMYHYFKLALCDHLIVTFAYRLYCDNLEPRSFNDYAYTLFDHLVRPISTSDQYNNIIRNEKRKQYRKDLGKKYKGFCKQFTLTDTNDANSCNSDNKGADSCNSGKKKKAKPTFLDTFVYAHNFNEKESSELSRRIAKSLDSDKIAPPAAWFLLFCASRKVKYTAALHDKKTPYKKISDMLRAITYQKGASHEAHNFDLVNVIFPIEDYDSIILKADIESRNYRSSRIGLYSTPQDFVLFAGTPIDSKDCLCDPFPSQTYYLKGAAREESTDTNRGTVTIPYNMQLVFNAYLANATFICLLWPTQNIRIRCA